eukprot:Em0001g693a
MDDNGMAIYGICGHGITRNWEMKTVLLAASPCGHERHTGEYIDIDAQTTTLLATVTISDSVIKRVHDNDSNMVLAWDKDGAIPCFDHTLELSVKRFTDELETTLCKFQLGVIHWFGGNKMRTGSSYCKNGKTITWSSCNFASVERVFSGVGLTFADLCNIVAVK